MRKTNGPRQNNRTASPQMKILPKRAESDGDERPETLRMFNILLALESARGLLKVRDVAALLGRSSWSVYRMAEKRQIPSLMIGGSRLFDPSVLALWLSKKEPTLAVAARRFKEPRKREMRFCNPTGKMNLRNPVLTGALALPLSENAEATKQRYLVISY